MGKGSEGQEGDAAGAGGSKAAMAGSEMTLFCVLVVRISNIHLFIYYPTPRHPTPVLRHSSGGNLK